MEVGNGETTAMVTLFANIVQERRSRVIATNEFSARVPAGKDAPAGVVRERAPRRLRAGIPARRGDQGSHHLQSALIFG